MNEYEALVEWRQGEAEVPEEKHIQEALVYRKSHMDWRGTKPEPLGWKNRKKPPEQLHGLKWPPAPSASKLKLTWNCDFPYNCPYQVLWKYVKRYLNHHTCLDAGTIARVGGAILFSNANASGNPTKRAFLHFMRLCEFVVNTDHAYSRPDHTAHRILTHACVIKWPPLYPNSHSARHWT